MSVVTVPSIFKRIRPAFRYDRSLQVLTTARDFGLVTKSNLADPTPATALTREAGQSAP